MPLQQVEPQQFVNWFRSVAPYIHAFRGRTFVIAFGGEVVADGKFVELTHDFNLLASLGVRLVLVHGARPQIEQLLIDKNLQGHYQQQIRITDAAAMCCVKEAVGRLRIEIEALLSMGLANSPMANADIRVAGGNFITAQPAGVIDGHDLIYSGHVRKVDMTAMRRSLEQNEVVLLSPIGYSPTGEAFNVTVEEVATSVAVALQAEKLIFLQDVEGILDSKQQLVPELTIRQAQQMLQTPDLLSEDVRIFLPCAVQACQSGVRRVHLISRHEDGAVLQELFSDEGIGTMLSADTLDTLRRADIDDVGGILRLLTPLEEKGILVRRSRERLEQEISRFMVLEHDQRIIGCAALYPFESQSAAELACLAVDPQYRDRGYGELILNRVVSLAREQHIRRLFVLTTQTAHWFVERQFEAAPVSALPKQKQLLYNYQRNSKVFVRSI